MMRSEGNPLDLNNFPEDYGKQFYEDSSSSAVAGGGGGGRGGVCYRKKKNGAKVARDDSGKVYECRFCSLKFCKSQALGGHMNRHRQERETETLNKARQLVFSSELAPNTHPLCYVSSGRPIQNGGGYHQTGSSTDPSLPFRSMYPTRLPLIPPPPPPAGGAPYMYASPPRLLPLHSPEMNDYYLGHALPSEGGSYTCIGAPVGHGLLSTGRGIGGGGRDMTLQGAEEGLNFGRRL